MGNENPNGNMGASQQTANPVSPTETGASQPAPAPVQPVAPAIPPAAEPKPDAGMVPYTRFAQKVGETNELRKALAEREAKLKELETRQVPQFPQPYQPYPGMQMPPQMPAMFPPAAPQAPAEYWQALGFNPATDAANPDNQDFVNKSWRFLQMQAAQGRNPAPKEPEANPELQSIKQELSNLKQTLTQKAEQEYMNNLGAAADNVEQGLAGELKLDNHPFKDEILMRSRVVLANFFDQYRASGIPMDIQIGQFQNELRGVLAKQTELMNQKIAATGRQVPGQPVKPTAFSQSVPGNAAPVERNPDDEAYDRHELTDREYMERTSRRIKEQSGLV